MWRLTTLVGDPFRAGVRIDRTNPLTQGLVVSVLPHLGEVVAGVPLTLYGAARRASGVGPFGRPASTVVSTSTGNDAVAMALGPTHPLYSVTTRLTVSVWVNPTAFVDYAPYLSVPYRNAAWAAPYQALALFRTAGLNTPVLQWAINSSSTQSLAGTVAYVVAGGGLQNLIMVRDGTSCRVYFQGTYRETVTATGNTAIDWTNKRPLVLFNADVLLPQVGWSGSTPGVDVWNRPLSDAEVRGYYQNRSQLYAPVLVQWFIPVGSSGGGAGALLSGDLLVQVGQEALLRARIEFASSLSAVVTASAALRTGMTLSASLPVTVTATGTLLGGSTLAASRPVTVTVSGTLSTGSFLQASVPVVVTTAASLQGGATLGASLTVSVTLSGTIATGLFSVVVDPATLTLTVSDIGMVQGARGLTVDPSTLTLGVDPITLEFTRAVSVAPASLTITLSPVTLVWHTVLQVEAASVRLDCAQVGLIFRRDETGWDTTLHPPIDACRDELSDALHPRGRTSQAFPLSRKNC